MTQVSDCPVTVLSSYLHIVFMCKCLCGCGFDGIMIFCQCTIIFCLHAFGCICFVSMLHSVCVCVCVCVCMYACLCVCVCVPYMRKHMCVSMSYFRMASSFSATDGIV